MYELQRIGALRTRLDASRARGFSKFVGRADEMATLEAALERSLHSHGQTVGVVAEAGTGKSRLCSEFVERCRARGFTVLEASAFSHGRNVPLLPMLAVFRAFFGVQSGDTELGVREKIAGRLLLLDESLREDLPIFFNLLGVPDPARPLPSADPDVLQRRAYAAVRALVHADGRREKPAILYFEDLHWLDAASDAYLEQIVEAVASTRGLVLTNFRPEYRAAWMQTPSYQQLPLVPLGAEAVRELLADLLGNDASIASLGEFVHARAEGNPFFIEEIVQTLIEIGALAGTRGAYRLVRAVGELSLPATVQALLSARIDRLPEREKHLLQQASVIGRTFQARVLARICALDTPAFEAAMRALREAEFVLETALYPQVEYTFKHPLTQEVAGISQLKERRAETHAAVARVLEELAAERLDEEAAMLAHHWALAGADRVAAHWHARAARWIGISNYTDAAVHWRRVFELLSGTEMDVDALRLRVEAVRSLFIMGYRTKILEDDATALFAAARADLAKLGDDAALALLTNTYSAIKQNAGAIDEYLALAAEADRIAEKSGNRLIHTAVGGDHAFALHCAGRLAESRSLTEQVRMRCAGEVAPGIEEVGISALIFSFMAGTITLIEMGRLHEAARELERGMALANEHGPDESRCWANYFRVILAGARGETGPGALTWARLASEAAERSGSQQARMMAHYCLAIAHVLDDQWQAGIAAAEHALTIWRTGFSGDFAVQVHAVQARALLGAGATQGAAEVAAQGIALARRQGQPVALCEAMVTHTKCLRAGDGVAARDALESQFEEVMQVIAVTGAERWRPHVQQERAEWYLLLGDEAAAAREFQDAHRLFVAMGASGHAERLAARFHLGIAGPG